MIPTTQNTVDLQRAWAELRPAQRTSARLVVWSSRHKIDVETLAQIVGAQECRTMCLAADATRSFAADRRDGSPDPDDGTRWRPR